MKTENKERATLTIAEIATILGININAAYQIARQEGFPALTVGKRILVPRILFESWLSDSAFAKKAYCGKYQKKSDFQANKD